MGNGIQVKLGEDPWVVSGNHYKLSGEMIDALIARGIFSLNQFSNILSTTICGQ